MADKKETAKAEDQETETVPPQSLSVPGPTPGADQKDGDPEWPENREVNPFTYGSSPEEEQETKPWPEGRESNPFSYGEKKGER